LRQTAKTSFWRTILVNNALGPLRLHKLQSFFTKIRESSIPLPEFEPSQMPLRQQDYRFHC